MEIFDRSWCRIGTPVIKQIHVEESSEAAEVGGQSVTLPGGWMQFILTFRNLPWDEAVPIDNFIKRVGASVFLLPVGWLNPPLSTWQDYKWTRTRLATVNRELEYVDFECKGAGGTEQEMTDYAKGLSGCLVEAQNRIYQIVRPGAYAGAGTGSHIFRLTVRPIFHRDTGAYPDFDAEGEVTASIHNPLARVVASGQESVSLPREHFNLVPTFDLNLHEAVIP